MPNSSPQDEAAHARVWLVNTGWSGGATAPASASALKHTRAIIDAIHSGALATARTERDPVFGFDVVTACPNVPTAIMIPRQAWADASAYDEAAKHLAALFNGNFKTYGGGVGAEIVSAGPV